MDRNALLRTLLIFGVILLVWLLACGAMLLLSTVFSRIR